MIRINLLVERTEEGGTFCNRGGKERSRISDTSGYNHRGDTSHYGIGRLFPDVPGIGFEIGIC